jgi:ribonucrease Y
MTELILSITVAVSLSANFILYFQFSKFKNLANSKKNFIPPSLLEIKLKEKDNEKNSIINQKERDSQDNLNQLKNDLEKSYLLVREKDKLELLQRLQTEELILKKRYSDLEDNLTKKEIVLDQKKELIEKEKIQIEVFKQELVKRENVLLQRDHEFQTKFLELEKQASSKLSSIANLTEQQAKVQIFEDAEKELGEELLQWQQKYVTNFERIAQEKAKEIAVLAIQRCSSEVANEFTITTVKIASDEDKGKLIGKQGRNILWLEKTLGVELIIDDTPGVITISGFSSIRRNVAKKTILKLLEDGRVHPSTIEEKYENAKSEIAQEIEDAGQWAVNELGIYDFPIELIKLLGRLKFRSGYGQNVLRHSVEMARLAGLLADGINAEFDLTNPIDRMVCVKGALLHDIGKAVDEDMSPKGNHIEIGEKVCDMFGLEWKIKKCIASHHTTGGDKQSYWDNEREEICLEAAIVDACDTLSGARPGARKETTEAFYQRVEALENIAKKVSGVTKSWIMRGARELWVFFNAENMTPTQVYRSVRKLAREIHNTIKTPQEIRVIGIREDRVEAYTR